MRIAPAVVSVLLLAGSLGAQAPSGYLDFFVVKVKPEKRAEFDTVVKRMVEANRRHNGDTWVAWETTYGEGNTVYFISTRSNIADAEKGMGLFMGALQKVYGPAGAANQLQQFNNTVVSARGELRRRRPDLSSNFPADISALNKIVGETRWLRTVTVRVRPGRGAEYEALLAEVKAARERSADKSPVSVTQSVAGQAGIVYYITTLKSSLGAFDSTLALPLILGTAGYQKYQKAAAEVLLGTETIINRAVPELSNPPQEVLSVAPDFWRPKPPPPKPASSGSAPQGSGS